MGVAALFRFDVWLVAPVLGLALAPAGLRHRSLGRVLGAFLGGLAVAAACYVAWSLATRGVLKPARRGPFSTPLWQGALLLTVSPAKGVLLFAPWLLLAPLGLRTLARRSPGLAIAAAGIFLVQLCTFARWWDWGSGTEYGPRFLAPAAAILALPVAAALEADARWKRWTFGALVAVGLAVAIPGALQFSRVHDVDARNAWTRVAPVEAWRALISSREVYTEYFVMAPGVDSLSRREPLIAVLAAVTAGLGAAMLRRSGWKSGSASS